MKSFKIIIMTLLVVLLAFAFCGCRKGGNTVSGETSETAADYDEIIGNADLGDGGSHVVDKYTSDTGHYSAATASSKPSPAASSHTSSGTQPSTGSSQSGSSSSSESSSQTQSTNLTPENDTNSKYGDIRK